MKPSKAVKQARRTAWNSTLPAPSKPMKRSPLERRTRLKARRVSKRFAKRRNPEYRAFIRTFPCLVRFRIPIGGTRCAGLVECAHVKSRAAGGFDVGDSLPLCHAHHKHQHQIGIQSFQKLYGVDMPKLATLLADMWKLAKGYPEEVLEGAGFR